MASTLPREVEIVEGATTRLSGVLVDDAGDPLPGSTLTTFRLTIYNQDTGQTVLVNDRDILNTNNATVDEDGNVVVLLAPADVLVQGASLPYERHTCLFTWTWGTTPVKTGRAELVLVHRNLAKVS